ncbi:MAG: iron ABC transporter permease [Chitinispirillaceae bacterium]|nr:iron ABC transporter permease [Chitinispirillaceae bacterium]
MSVGKRLLLLSFSSMIIVIFAPCIGMEFIVPFDLKNTTLQMEIFTRLRLPRVLVAFFAGAGLSLCGMVFQALFRNPLADPFTLGIASGASCGAALTVVLGFTGALLGVPAVTIGAFLGSACATLLLFGFASYRRSTDKLTFLLAGVALSFLFSSLLMFFQYISDPHDSYYIIRWLMGGVEAIGYKALFSFLPFEIIGIIIIFSQLPQLDHLLTGDDIAQSRGVDIKRTRILLLLATTMMVGTIVAVCGPIGFIGLIVPHISRSLFSWKHLWAGPATALSGGVLLVIADTIARTVIAPTEIPVGVITALLGAPFFLWILFHHNGNGKVHEL